MAQIAVKYAGRGETYRAVSQIALLSRAYIALWRLLQEDEGPEPLLNWTNRVLEPELDAALPQLGQHIDPAAALAVVQALCEAVERFHGTLAEHAVAIPVAMPAEVQRLARLARDVMLEGVLPKRKYR
jgi:hypothetical protein